MAGEEGFKVATAYVALTIADEDVKAQIEEAVTSACEQAGTQGGETLTAEITAAVDGASTDLGAPLVEAISQAGVEAAAAFDDEITPEIEAAIRELNGPIVESMAATGGEAGAAFVLAAEEELAAWRETVAEATSLGASVPGSVGDVFAQVDAGAMSAADAVAALEASLTATGSVAEMSAAEFNTTAAALRTVGTSSGLTIDQLKAVSVTFADAAAAADKYGTSEAQLSISTAALGEAQGALADANATLMQTYLVLADSGEADLQGLQSALEDLATAQGAVTDASTAQVAAMTEVNLAVIRNTDALMNDEAALRSFASASEMTGVNLVDLTAQLEEGSFAALDEAAATAQAELNALALEAAQQQLAAANVTLIDTYQQLAAGAEVSAEQQTAALAAVAAAQREVSVLSGGMNAEVRGASAAIGGLAGAMGGPWLWGIMGVATMLPMLGQMLQSNAIDAATFTQAVQQDSNAVGDNTAATIQNALAKTDLNSMAQVLGVTQAQLIEYAAGETDAQNQVTAAYQRVDAYQQKHVQNATAGLQAQKDQLDQVAASVQQAINQERDQTNALIAAEQTTQIFNASLDDLHSKMLQQAQSSAMSTVAALGFSDGQSDLNRTLSDAVDAFDVTNAQASAYATVLGAMNPHLIGAAQYEFVFQQALDATAPKLQAQASSTALSAVAALQLGDNQTAANLELYNSVMAYTEATTGASGYNAALQAANGSINNLLGSEASFTIALKGLTTAVQTNGKSLDVNNEKGAQNVQVMTQIAQAADKAALAVYQNDVNNGNASRAYQDATTKLQQEKDAFEAAAEKAGFQKTQVQQLADELFKLPPEIQIGANISPALTALNGLVQKIDDSQGYVQIYASQNGSVAGGKALLPGKADGGPVQAGQAYIVGERRAEVFVPEQDGTIYPSLDEGRRALGGGTTIYQQFYGTQYPTTEQMAILHRELASAVGAF